MSKSPIIFINGNAKYQRNDFRTKIGNLLKKVNLWMPLGLPFVTLSSPSYEMLPVSD